MIDLTFQYENMITLPIVGFRMHPPICGRGREGALHRSSMTRRSFFVAVLAFVLSWEGRFLFPAFRFRECRTYDRHQIIYSYDRGQKYGGENLFLSQPGRGSYQKKHHSRRGPFRLSRVGRKLMPSISFLGEIPVLASSAKVG